MTDNIEKIRYKLKKTYFKMLKACLKGDEEKQRKLEQKLIKLELKKTGKI